MTARIRSRTFFLSVLAAYGLSAPAIATEYVPGMNCHEVGGFAEAVVVQKSLGDTLKEQIDGMRQSIPGRSSTQSALEKIIRAVYANPALRKASPDDVGKAYERACMAISG